MKPGELRRLLDGCRAGDPSSLERFVHWLTSRGTMVLRIYDLSKADRDDVIASARDRILSANEREGIRGDSNGEIDAYIATSFKRQALNFGRTRTRKRETGEQDLKDMADEQLSQEARALVNEQIRRAEVLIQSWTPADRYLFMAKLNGVPANVIQQTLARPPYETYIAVGTIDTRFHRLRQALRKHREQP